MHGKYILRGPAAGLLKVHQAVWQDALRLARDPHDTALPQGGSPRTRGRPHNASTPIPIDLIGPIDRWPPGPAD